MKRLLLLCFGIGMGSFLIGMDDNNIYQSYRRKGGLFPDNETYYTYQWLKVGPPIQVSVNNSIQTYQLEAPKKKDDEISGRAFVDGEEVGHYEIIHEKERHGSYIYTATYYPNNKTDTFYYFPIRQKKGVIEIMVNGDFTIPKKSERLELFKEREQLLLQKTKNKADQWNSLIQTDWGQTTHGKCISGITALLALYGTGRILWDTQTQWKKGGAYLLSLLKKIVIKKRKRRKKHHHSMQEIS